MKIASWRELGSDINYVGCQCDDGQTFLFVCKDSRTMEMIRKVVDYAKNPMLSGFGSTEACAVVGALAEPEFYERHCVEIDAIFLSFGDNK
jgi:hypothetical protein